MVQAVLFPAAYLYTCRCIISRTPWISFCGIVSSRIRANSGLIWTSATLRNWVICVISVVDVTHLTLCRNLIPSQRGQQWNFIWYHRLIDVFLIDSQISSGFGKCLAVENDSTINGTRIVATDCSINHMNQRWHI